jgi:hypothetical protein
VYARSTSHEKAVEHRVLRQRHQQLKLVSHRSGVAVGKHDLGYLLLRIVLTVHDLQAEDVTVEGNRRLHVGDGNADMIKTKQTRKHSGEIGGFSGHEH